MRPSLSPRHLAATLACAMFSLNVPRTSTAQMMVPPAAPVTVSTVPGTTHEITLSLATVAAGEYLVEVTAKSAAGESKTLIPFRVTS